MKTIDHLEQGKNYFYAGGFFSAEYNQELYLKKAKDDGSHKPKYYINVFTFINGEFIQQGYIYFYLNFDSKSSDFIGISVAQDFRNLNIGSLLIASWIDFCMNHGFDFLGSNKKQRKPFLIYLLKTYGFELLNPILYESRNDVISIGRSYDFHDKTKYLLFHDEKEEKIFRKTNIYQNDNYQTIHDTEEIIILDQIILPFQNSSKNGVEYKLVNHELALKKSLNVISRHTR